MGSLALSFQALVLFLVVQAVLATSCDVVSSWAYGGTGFELEITAPQHLERVTSPIDVRLSLAITDGPEATEIRSSMGEYEVCYGALGSSRCVPVTRQAEVDARLEVPEAWTDETPAQIVAWLERKACLTRIAKASVDVVVTGKKTAGLPKFRFVLPRPGQSTSGEYVNLEIVSTRGHESQVCCAVGDFRTCGDTPLSATATLPVFGAWRAYAWGDGAAPPAVVEFATSAPRHHYRFGRYTHPRPASPWLSFGTNYTVRMPVDCPTPRTAACALERRVSCGNDCHYFQHAAPFLMACWSFFRLYGHLPPVLVLRDGLFLGDHRWTRGVLDSMRCRVVQQTIPRCAVLGTLEPGATSWTPQTPGTKADLGWVPLSWLASATDAAALADLVLRNEEPPPPPRARVAARVGILDRAPPSGHLLHAHDIAAALADALSSTVDVALFENATLAEQAAWMRDHDVVISPHGAQLTNLVFLQPCAAILELSPAHYFVPGYFLTLALNAGALAYVGYPGDAPERDVERVLAMPPHSMTNFRKAPIRLDGYASLVAVVRAAVADRTRCLAGARDDDIGEGCETPPPLAIVSPRPGDNVAEHFDVLLRLGALEPNRDGDDPFVLDRPGGSDEWSVCVAALGDRTCAVSSPGLVRVPFRLPAWAGERGVRLAAWLESARFGSWISPAAVDIFLVQSPDSCDDDDLGGIHLTITHPLPNATVPSPVAARLDFRASPSSRPRDFRTFRICYAALDQRRCSLLWPHQRAVAPHEHTALGLERFALPSGAHQLAAWIEADGTDAVVFHDVRIHVLPGPLGGNAA